MFKEWYRPKEVFRMARLLNKDKRAAAKIRMRFLNEEINRLLEYDCPVAAYWAEEACQELQSLHKAIEEKPVFNGNGIDEAMIQRAIDYPVEALLEFDRFNKAMAWCHDDTRPSLSHNKKNNTVRCFVCNKTFDPINILCEKEGITFVEAVRRLA